MDFLRIIQSLEELLYEVMTWLIFYPRTLWSSIRHPIQMLRYSERELKDAPKDQFTDMLSPPLFLMLTILLSHVIEVSSHQKLPEATTAMGRQIMASDQNLLLLQSILFSIYPLMFALRRLRAEGTPLNRQTLRQPFFAQCYVAAPAALVLGLASIMMRTQMIQVALGGLVVALITILWYLRIETIWLRIRLHKTRVAAFRSALGTWLMASFINSIASLLILGI